MNEAELLAEIEALKQQIRQCALSYMPEYIQDFVTMLTSQEQIIGQGRLEHIAEFYGEGYTATSNGFNSEFNKWEYLKKRGFAVETYRDRHWRKSSMNDVEWHYEAFGRLTYINVKYRLTDKGYKLSDAINEAKQAEADRLNAEAQS